MNLKISIKVFLIGILCLSTSILAQQRTTLIKDQVLFSGGAGMQDNLPDDVLSGLVYPSTKLNSDYASWLTTVGQSEKKGTVNILGGVNFKVGAVINGESIEKYNVPTDSITGEVKFYPGIAGVHRFGESAPVPPNTNELPSENAWTSVRMKYEPGPDFRQLIINVDGGDPAINAWQTSAGVVPINPAVLGLQLAGGDFKATVADGIGSNPVSTQYDNKKLFTVNSTGYVGVNTAPNTSGALLKVAGSINAKNVYTNSGFSSAQEVNTNQVISWTTGADLALDANKNAYQTVTNTGKTIDVGATTADIFAMATVAVSSTGPYTLIFKLKHVESGKLSEPSSYRFTGSNRQVTLPLFLHVTSAAAGNNNFEIVWRYVKTSGTRHYMNNQQTHKRTRYYYYHKHKPSGDEKREWKTYQVRYTRTYTGTHDVYTSESGFTPPDSTSTLDTAYSQTGPHTEDAVGTGWFDTWENGGWHNGYQGIGFEEHLEFVGFRGDTVEKERNRETTNRLMLNAHERISGETSGETGDASIDNEEEEEWENNGEGSKLGMEEEWEHSGRDYGDASSSFTTRYLSQNNWPARPSAVTNTRTTGVPAYFTVQTSRLNLLAVPN